MRPHFSLFHLYQNKGRNNNPFKVSTRNSQIPLINTKNSMINQEQQPNFHSIEYRLPNSFRIKLKQSKNAKDNLSKTKVNSLYQSMNYFKPKQKSDYNSCFTRNTQTLRKGFKYSLNNQSKKPVEATKLIFLKANPANPATLLVTQKEDLKQLLNLQYQPNAFKIGDGNNGNCKGNDNNKKNNETLNPRKNILLKSIDEGMVKCQSNTYEIKSSIKKQYTNSNKSDDDLGVLSLDEVKDIIVYNDFSTIPKDFSYLFHQDDYEMFVKTKSVNYLNAFSFV